MLYLLFVLTFLAGILFYGMTPRDDKLHLDTYQAEGMIAAFLNQHQAAKDYLFTWLGAGSSNIQDNDGFLNSEFEEMTPRSMTLSTCCGNRGTPGKNGCYQVNEEKTGCTNETMAGFVSRVICVGEKNIPKLCSSDEAKKHYVVTYGGWENETRDRPNWWPSEEHRTRRYERWRRAIARRTRGSHNCGVLLNIEGEWCIDNGERVFRSGSSKVCLNQVPKPIIDSLKASYGSEALLHDMLFCYSAFDQGVKPGPYAVTADYFYDGLSNVGVGQHNSSNSEAWTNLAGTDTIASVNFAHNYTGRLGVPYWVNNGGTQLNTGIELIKSLDESFTVTILARVHKDNQAFSFFSVPNGIGGTSYVFTLQRSDAQGDYFCVGSNESPDCTGNKIVAKNSKTEQSSTDYVHTTDSLISWTFVGKKCSGNDHTCLTVYENTIPHGEFDLGFSLKEKNLIVGGLNGDYIYIYGIRYYGRVLDEKAIEQNFKVDRKRFGLGDIGINQAQPTEGEE